MSDRLGLIAGSGELPLEIARAARGRPVFALGFPGITDSRLEGLVDDLAWQPFGALEALLGTFRDAGTRELVLAGKIEKAGWVGHAEDSNLDSRARHLLAGLGARGDAKILAAVGEVLEQEGFKVLPQSLLVPHLVPHEGLLGKVEPSAAQWRDLALGWPLVKQLAEADIGQCMVVKDGVVVAVEALEGTDEMLVRAVTLVGGGLSMLKLAARGHDPRFDLPTVGPRTLEPLIAAGGGVMAVEADTTLMLSRARLLERADRSNVAVIAIGPDGPDALEDVR